MGAALLVGASFVPAAIAARLRLAPTPPANASARLQRKTHDFGCIMSGGENGGRVELEALAPPLAGADPEVPLE